MELLPENIANPKQCSYCNHIFSKISVCTNHMLKCKGLKEHETHACVCNKTYKHKKNMLTHQNTCQAYKDYIASTSSNGSASGKDITQCAISGKEIVTAINSHNNTTNNTNTTINNNNNQTININPVGQENLSHITQADIKRILNSGHNAFKTLIDTVYELDENKNLCFANKKENRLMFLRELNRVDIDNATKILNKLVGNYEDKLDEYIDEFCTNAKKSDSSLCRLLTDLSNKHADGENDLKNLNTMINIVMLIGSTAKQQLLQKNSEIALLKKQLLEATNANSLNSSQSSSPQPPLKQVAKTKAKKQKSKTK